MANGRTEQEMEEAEALARGGKTARIATSVLAAKSFTFLAAGIAFIIVARILGPGTYGVYTLAIAIAGFFGSFGDFGFSLSAVKFIAEYIEKKNTEMVKSTITNAYAAAALIGIIFTVIAFAASGPAALLIFHNASYAPILEVASFTIIVGVLWNVSYSMLVGLGKGRYITFAVVLQSLAQALLSIGFALAGFGAAAPILGVVIGFFIGFIAATSIEAKILGISPSRMTAALSWKEIKRLFAFSLPLGISNFVTGVTSNFSTIFLGLYATSFVLGNYGITYKVSSMFDVVVGSVGFALLPLFSATLVGRKQNKNIGKFYNYSIYMSLLVIAPVAFYIIFLSLPFSYTVFGGAYSLAPLYISIMSIGVLLTILSSYSSNLLISAGKVKSFLKFNIIISALQIAFLILLVPTYNGLGLVALLFLIIPVATNILYMSKLSRMFKMKIDFARFARVIASSVASAVFIVPLIYLFDGNTIPLLIVAAVEQLVVYPIIISKLGAIDRKNTELLSRITKGVPLVGSVMRSLIAYTNIFLR